MLAIYLQKETQVYTTVIPGVGEFSYRLLTIQEYKRLNVLRNVRPFYKWELEEEVFSYCYLGKASLLNESIPAGASISIGKLILWLSGDCDTIAVAKDIAISRKLNPANTLHEYMRAVILSAFPSYKLEDIESWNRLEFIRKFTVSENILKKKDESYEFLDLNKIGKSEEKKKESTKPIDFAAENAAIMKSQNRMDVEETLDKLNQNQARALDRRRR